MRRATEAVLSIYSGEDLGVSYKDEKEPVTEADLAANRILEEHLMQLIPEAGWLSEESDRDLQALAQKHYLWVVDPIDGTREFIERNGEFSISVGLVEKGQPIWGAVSIPAEDRIVTGGGQGIEVHDRKTTLKQSHRPLDMGGVDLRKSRICVSATEWKQGVYDDQKQDLHIHPEGSVARKLALVATGDYDLTVSLYPKNDWDIAGGLALIEAAGGIIVRPDTGEGILLHPPGAPRPGLCCGRADPVMQYHQYFHKKGLRMREKYGEN